MGGNSGLGMDPHVEGEGEYKAPGVLGRTVEETENSTAGDDQLKEVEKKDNNEPVDSQEDAVTYGAGANSMDEIASNEEDGGLAENEEQSEDIPVEETEPVEAPVEKQPGEDIDPIAGCPIGGSEDFTTGEEKQYPTEPVFTDNPKLKDSNKPGFNPDEKQDARVNDAQEGGVAKSRTTGINMKTDDALEEGHQLKPDEEDAVEYGKYMVSGFSVSYEPIAGKGLISRSIINYFGDLESAQASVVGDKYLMPLTQGGYKVVTITSGAPKISIGDREVYEYLNTNSEWRKI